MAAAASLPPDQQNEMIRGMVERLADRLKNDGADADGWQRLVRSYLVLGERDKAIAAVADARRALGGAPDKMQPIEALLNEQPGVASTTTSPGSRASAPQTAATQPAAPSLPGPSQQDMAAAANLPTDQQNEMIRGMVQRLADRLKNEGSDVEGWQRLLRSYMVLGDRENARLAATNARRALANEPDKLRQLDAFVKELGLGG